MGGSSCIFSSKARGNGSQGPKCRCPTAVAAPFAPATASFRRAWSFGMGSVVCRPAPAPHRLSLVSYAASARRDLGPRVRTHPKSDAATRQAGSQVTCQDYIFETQTRLRMRKKKEKARKRKKMERKQGEGKHRNTYREASFLGVTVVVVVGRRRLRRRRLSVGCTLPTRPTF